MTIDEFTHDLNDDVSKEAIASGSGTTASFVSTMMKHVIAAEFVPEYTQAFYKGTGLHGRNVRVDGYYYDENDRELVLLIAKQGDVQTQMSPSEVKQCMEPCVAFIEEAASGRLAGIEPSTDVYDLMALIKDGEAVEKFCVALLYSGSVSSRLKILDSRHVVGKLVSFQVWDIQRVYKVYEEGRGRENIEINFKQYAPANGIPYVAALENCDADYKSYLCIIPATALADIYDRYGSKILEGNVRSFLTTKVDTNKKMRETILGNPSRFFAYNNGVSATARNLRFEEIEGAKFVVFAEDFQIINGGQTTATLSFTRRKDGADISKIYVQMKLTEITGNKSQDDVDELVRDISKSSNSQNKVTDADFFSTHPYHILLERLSRSVKVPRLQGEQYDSYWFYERVRGQYFQKQMAMTASEKKKFQLEYPESRTFGKTELAKFWNTWLLHPDVVSKGANTNIKEFAVLVDEMWGDDGKGFDEAYFKKSVALNIIFTALEKTIPKQEWFRGSYRANVVTYAMALCHKKITDTFKGKDLDLVSIWDKQSVPEELLNVFLTVAEYVYGKITSDDRPVENVTQWCKRKNCWSGVLEAAPEFDLGVCNGYLVDAEMIQVSDATIDKVVAIGSSALFDARKWGVDNDVLNFAGKGILLSVARLLKYSKRPSHKQARATLKILESLKDKGYEGAARG